MQINIGLQQSLPCNDVNRDAVLTAWTEYVAAVLAPYGVARYNVNDAEHADSDETTTHARVWVLLDVLELSNAYATMQALAGMDLLVSIRVDVATELHAYSLRTVAKRNNDAAHQDIDLCNGAIEDALLYVDSQKYATELEEVLSNF